MRAFATLSLSVQNLTVRSPDVAWSEPETNIMVLFGGMGYLMKKFDYEPAPLMLAFVLGPLVEKSIRQSLVGSQGSPLIFFTRPVSLALMSAAILIIVFPAFSRIWRSLRRSGQPFSFFRV